MAGMRAVQACLYDVAQWRGGDIPFWQFLARSCNICLSAVIRARSRTMEPWFRGGLAPLYDAPPLFASRDPLEAKLATAGALKEHDLVWRSGQVDSSLRHLQL